MGRRLNWERNAQRVREAHATHKEISSGETRKRAALERYADKMLGVAPTTKVKHERLTNKRCAVCGCTPVYSRRRVAGGEWSAWEILPFACGHKNQP